MLLTEASGLPNACWPCMWFLEWVFRLGKDPELSIVNDPYAASTGNGSPDLEQADASKAVAAVSKITQIVTKWKDDYNKEELSFFLEQMTIDSKLKDDAGAPAVVEAFMASEGQCSSGVTKLSDLLQDYEPTPKSYRYPTPKQLVDGFLKEQGDIPCFLLPPSHPLHVPPHIVAVWLMSEKAKNTKAALKVPHA